jgi:hypothetical protein
MPEYGLYQGLAVKIPYDQMIQEDRQQRRDIEEAKSRAENRVRLYAEDLDYNNVMNAWDHEQIKNYADKQIAELGKFQSENPNWKYNQQLYNQYKILKNGIKDNDHVHKGMRVQAQIDAHDKWVQDPKNADVRDLPEVQQYKQQIANYITTGSIDGIKENAKEFRFLPPENYDFNPLLEQFGKKTPKTLKSQSVLANGLLSLKYGATDNDIKNQANSYLTNLTPYQSKKWNYEYKQKLAELGQTPDKYSLENYTADRLEGHVTPDEFQHAAYHVNDGNGRDSGKIKPPTMNDSLLSGVLKRSYSALGVPTQYTPASAEDLYVGKNGQLNTSGAKIFSRDTNGSLRNVFDLKGISTDDWDFSNTKIVSLPVYNPETKKNDGHASFVSGTIRLTPDEFKQMVGNENAVYDPWGFGETELDKQYRGDAKIINKKGKDGKDVDLIETTINFPLQADNPQVHQVSDHAAGTKALQYGYGGDEESGRFKISPDGKMYQDTQTGTIYDRATNKPIQQ